MYRAQARETWWARIRHRIIGDDAAPRSDRLKAIGERDLPSPRQGIDPAALAKMTPAEICANRQAITEPMANTVTSNMNALKGLGS
ncbi:hypothetical protein [Pseudorhodobacter sp.]|uniref:hypothetical protein n=1 Tax=Pseudorhodobacter sp. TaxID=1934400 RepID=UPI002647E9F3|nr:hypothetical protein [Pseudorhodobacter sp.]MDN5786693.1 hypothetical protein [Pseudorhodobacter sp.]